MNEEWEAGSTDGHTLDTLGMNGASIDSPRKEVMKRVFMSTTPTVDSGTLDLPNHKYQDHVLPTWRFLDG